MIADFRNLALTCADAWLSAVPSYNGHQAFDVRVYPLADAILMFSDTEDLLLDQIDEVEEAIEEAARVDRIMATLAAASAEWAAERAAESEA